MQLSSRPEYNVNSELKNTRVGSLTSLVNSSLESIFTCNECKARVLPHYITTGKYILIHYD